MNNAQLINQTSGDFECYTPPAIIEAARTAMGSIDLDPASSKKANQTVKAGRIFTLNEDGLKQSWWGNVWLNHPFGRNLNQAWMKKLADEFVEGRTKQACCITYACTSESWFQPLMNKPQCYLSPRTNYLLPDGTVKKGVTKGSVVTYFGQFEDRFAKAFCNLGNIKVSYVFF